VAVEAGHRDAAVGGHVDVRLLRERLRLRLREPGEAEHADLLLDVRPLAGRVERDERVVQLVAHADDAVRHALDLALPLRVQLRVAEDRARDARAVQRRVGVHRPDHDLQLALDARALLGVRGDERERTDALAVETHVLRERLAERDLVTLAHEVAWGERIVCDVAGREALVGHVEEGEVLLVLEERGELLPLVVRRVDAGRVVRTRMQEDDRVLRGVLIDMSAM
jgi:hypothetical protein